VGWDVAAGAGRDQAAEGCRVVVVVGSSEGPVEGSEFGKVQIVERDLHSFVRLIVIHEGHEENRCSIAETFTISGRSAGSGMTLVIAASMTSRK